jgi:tetratricopeptide (TPR) repeat protein
MVTKPPVKDTRTSGLRRAVWLLEAGLLFALPLVFYRGFAEQFSYAKVVLTETLVVLGLAGWAAGMVWGKLRWPVRFRMGPPLGLLVAAVLVSSLTSPVPSFSLVQAEYFLCGPLWLLLLVSWRRSEADAPNLGALIAAAGASAAVIALLQWLGHDPLLFGGYRVEWGTMVPRMRLYSTFGNPNFLCGYLIGAIFPALAMMLAAARRAVRIASGAAAALMFVAIVGTGSYGGWAGLVAGLVAAGFILMRAGKTAPWQEGIIEGRSAGVLHAALGPVLMAALWFVESPNPSFGSRVAGRVYLSRIGWQMFAEHPLLGSGWGTFQLRFLDYQARFLAVHRGLSRFWTLARELHNDPFQILLEAGLFGFAAFAWLLAEYARDVWAAVRAAENRSRSFWLSAGAGGAVAILADSLVNFQFAVPPTLILLFTLLAFPYLLATPEKSEVDESRTAIGAPLSPWRRAAVRGLAASAVAVLCGTLLFQIAQRAQAEYEYAAGKDLEERGDYAGAEQADRLGISRTPSSGKLHFALARALFLQQRYPEALGEVHLAEPTWSDSHLEVLKARALDKMGQAGPALESYRRALALDPTLKTIQADIERLEKSQGP